MSACPHCGQPMPAQPRRDPPLPPLDKPAVVTIHDLPPEQRANVDLEEEEIFLPAGRSYTFRRLKDPAHGR